MLTLFVLYHSLLLSNALHRMEKIVIRSQEANKGIMQHLKACRILKVHIVLVMFVSKRDSDVGGLTREF